MRKRRELNDIEKHAADKLKAIWLNKSVELNLTQESVALSCGWSGQAAFSQYINQHIPLNIEAVLRLSKALKVHPTDIMPSISELLTFSNSSEFTQSTVEFARIYQQLPHDKQKLLSDTAKAFLLSKD
jgi:hypothetical protein